MKLGEYKRLPRVMAPRIDFIYVYIHIDFIFQATFIFRQIRRGFSSWYWRVASPTVFHFSLPVVTGATYRNVHSINKYTWLPIDSFIFDRIIETAGRPPVNWRIFTDRQSMGIFLVKKSAVFGITYFRSGYFSQSGNAEGWDERWKERLYQEV